MCAKKKTNRKKAGGLMAVILCMAAVCGVLCWLLTEPAQPLPDHTAGSTAQTRGTEAPTVPVETKPVLLEQVEEVSINLGSGLRIADVGKYTGVYMEDGSDEIVTGILMITVTNEGENAIQYAEIALPVGDQTAEFSLSTLPAGATVVLLEKNRMDYVSGDYVTAVAENVVLFEAPLDLCEDRLKIQALDGAINVSNISGQDIGDDIIIYYKNSAADVYYGGITYRVRLEGGLKAGEVKQIVAGHFSPSGSSVLFVTCGGG